MDAKEDNAMTQYNKITALYSRLSVGDEDRDGGESNSIVNQKVFLERYARQEKLTNIRHYIDDDESGRFFDRSAYVRMMDDVESGKIGIVVMKDMTRWGRDYLQVGNAMEIFRRNKVRFIAVNNGIDSEKPDTLEFAPFINIMSEWYAKDISKKVKTGIKTKGMSGKPVATEAPYGYMKDPDNKDYWIIDEEAAAVVRLIFSLFLEGKNRNQIAVYLKNEEVLTPTFYLKYHDRGTSKSRNLNEENRYNWNKATLTRILTRQEYCGDVVNFKTAKHYRDKRNHYVDKSEWQIFENVHEPIIDRETFENVQRILENAPVRRPNGDGEIHPLSGLLFCKDCGAKMHIRIDYRYSGKRHIAFCSEYRKGKGKNPKCHSPHNIDADLLLQTVADVLRKIADYSISNKADFEALVKKSLAIQQTDKVKKQQKRIPQITARLEQIDTVLNKLYEDIALGRIKQDRYEQMSKKYSEEYYTLKTELAEIKEQLSAFENADGRAQRFMKLTERYAAFTELTPAILNEFISKILVHERDVKRSKYAVHRIELYFNHIGRFENELTEQIELTEQECERMRAEIEEVKREKSRAYHRAYYKEYRKKNLERCREYERMKAREYRAKKKLQAAT
jgi:DNA invertase Pin-like site-specific DNA recombinase